MKNNICVLGSTGSVGTQTLEVAEELGIKVDSISANSNIDLLEKQIRIFKPKIAAVLDESKAVTLRERVNDTFTKVLAGKEAICQAATFFTIDTVVTAISGIAGLKPTFEAINAKKNIAIANKETLVTGGSIITNLAKNKKIHLLPVDSEHSAIFQCIERVKNKKDIKKLILTASGGPFFGKKKSELENVTINQALNHPSWSMGKKISIDSATMMNKGLEIIEAAHLFGVPVEDIDVIIHRESVVHSMVEFQDNSLLAQLATPSMKIPIQYALTYPEHISSNVKSLGLADYKTLSFFEMDYKTFEAIEICRNAFRDGENSCIILNAANEKAVELFLKSKIKFNEIIEIIKFALENMHFPRANSIEEIEKIDLKVKEKINLIYSRKDNF